MCIRDRINSDYLNNLNKAQKEAVLYTNGPLLIVAGAGSGKTKVLTSRIANIIIPPNEFGNINDAGVVEMIEFIAKDWSTPAHNNYGENVLRKGLVVLDNLFENKFMVEDKDSRLEDSLFGLSISKELSLIESHSEVDFFIKQKCFFSTSNLIEKMSKIQNISLIYRVPTNELTENFNFDL